ncbi:MAG: hypothetical protein H6598_06475 [Flavobacteriales bacterium]|nr:hypothetical protein [Flavobacteriales bacterium]
MKTYLLIIASIILIQTNTSCSEKESDPESTANSQHESNETINEVSGGKNEITKLKFDDTDQDFDQKYVYANFNSIYQSYRIIYLNYDKKEDSDFGQRTGDQMKIVIGLFNPDGGEFKPGKYTWAGNSTGMNKIAVQVETGNGLKTCNTAGIEDAGYVEITNVSKEFIKGNFHVNGVGFEVSGSFDTKNEPVN